MGTSKKIKRHRRKEKQHRTQRRLEIFYSLGVSAVFIAGVIFLAYMILPTSRYTRIISRAGDWMISRQEDSGHFGYEYDPWNNTESNDDNVVRQAGAVYILSELFDYYNDGKYLSSTAQGLEYLITQSENDEEMSYITDGESAKIGATSLALIACENIKGTALWDENIEKNCKGYENFILQASESDTGFPNKYNPEDQSYDTPSGYSNGEGWLALTTLYTHNSSENLKEILDNKFQFFDEHYREKIAQEQAGEDVGKNVIGFYLWGVRALNQLDESDPQEKYLDLAEVYTRHIIQTKSLSDLENNANNGYAFEGVIATYAIAVRHENKELQEYLRPLIEKNLERFKAFQVNNQTMGKITRNNRTVKTQLYSTEKSSGGFLNSLETDKQLMRIDYTQHCIGAYLLAEEYL